MNTTAYVLILGGYQRGWICWNVGAAPRAADHLMRDGR
jgi:hypothetical protein